MGLSTRVGLSITFLQFHLLARQQQNQLDVSPTLLAILKPSRAFSAILDTYKRARSLYLSLSLGLKRKYENHV